ncbi:MAG: hypothetical protein V4594_07955 [Bacteroidota bacterium]
MKNLLPILFAMLFIAASCSKKKELVEEINKQEILSQKIKDIIPEQYIDSLKKLGLTINSDFNPPNIEGTYIATPLIMKATSVPNDNVRIGGKFADGKFQLSAQTSDFDIKLLGRNLLHDRDTSIVTAIAGSGNNFTVYGKVRSTSGTKSAIFAIIMSGVKDGNTIRDFKMGLINIDNSKGGTGTFIAQGTGRIAVDSDGITSSLSQELFTAAAKDNIGFGLKYLGTAP